MPVTRLPLFQEVPDPLPIELREAPLAKRATPIDHIPKRTRGSAAGVALVRQPVGKTG